MSDHCGSVTEDGAAVCIPGACSCSTETKSSEPILLSVSPSIESKPARIQKIDPYNQNEENTMWKKIRSGVMFGVACVSSPCCTPLFIPLGLALLAGTPIAAWASTHLGWVYGGLTLLSIISLVLGVRWMGQRSDSKSSSSKSKTDAPATREVVHL
jgi:hypothetical protein